MVAGLARAFEASRLVQRDVQVLAIVPVLAVDREREAFGGERFVERGDDAAADADLAAADQGAARLARAETLRLQDPVEGQLAHAASRKVTARRPLFRTRA